MRKSAWSTGGVNIGLRRWPYIFHVPLHTQIVGYNSLLLRYFATTEDLVQVWRPVVVVVVAIAAAIQLHEITTACNI